MKRDLTEAQFRARLAKLGGTPAGFMGYVTFRWENGGNVSISRHNANSDRRRDQLRYLTRALNQHKAIDAKRAAESQMTTAQATHATHETASAATAGAKS